MGFSARKRIKIAEGVYQNISYSKNGLHTSTSVKIGDATINSSKNGLRGFLNLSSILPGARYTSEKPKKESPTESNTQLEKEKEWDDRMQRMRDQLERMRDRLERMEGKK